MSFKTAVKFLVDYRKERAKALNNEQVMGWSTSPVKDLEEMVKTFDSTKENSDWRKLFNNMRSAQLPPSGQMQQLRASINFLAGCRRDVRIMFAAGDSDRPRVDADYDRYEYSRLAIFNYILDLADKVMDSLTKA